jgi:voltage-gated potassium channel
MDDDRRLSEAQDAERLALLEQLQEWLEGPMLVLAFIWLALFVVEVVFGLGPMLELVGYFIWALFVLQFALEFTLAKHKTAYLRSNWLTVLALAAPALRMLRVVRPFRFTGLARGARAARGARVLRVLSSLNRGMRALRASMGRRGLGYLLLLTLIVILAGAAGMYTLEREGQFHGYGDALWWTAMLITTIGSEFWPETPEARLLCFVLSLYGLAVFGYVTAALATFFIGQDAQSETAELPSARSLAELRGEIRQLREQLRNGGLERSGG